MFPVGKLKKKKFLEKYFFGKYFLYKYFLHNIRYGFTKSKKLSKSHLIMIADMRGVKVKKLQKKDESFKILNKNVKKKKTMNHHLNQ